MTEHKGGWVERVAFALAIVFVVVLGVLEFTVYRPQQRRLNAAEAEMATLQEQLAGLARRNLADQELYLYADTGPDGQHFRELYSAESGLEYLTRMIGRSGLERLDFQAGSVRQDGPFRVEGYAVVLRGTYGRTVAFLKNLESEARLSRVEFLKVEPAGGSDVAVSLRVAVYGLMQR